MADLDLQQKLEKENKDLRDTIGLLNEQIGELSEKLNDRAMRLDDCRRTLVSIADAEPLCVEAYREILRDKLEGAIKARFEHQNPARDGGGAERLIEFTCGINTLVIDHERHFDLDMPIPTEVSLTVPVGEVSAEVVCELVGVHPPTRDHCLQSEYAVEVTGRA